MDDNAHQPRLNITTVAPKIYAIMRQFGTLLEESDVDAGLREIMKIRASQINGCAFCLDMHLATARKCGITDDRLHMLTVWRDAPCFSEPERVALELTEAVTRIAEGGVSDALYEEARRHYSAEQYVALLATINVINAWNRFMIGLGVAPPRH